MNDIVPIEIIAGNIFIIRGERVIIDRDLAQLYNVTTKALNQAVSRNKQRFPADFMFRLSKQEKHELVTNCDQLNLLKHSSSLPRAFTEQGVAMLSSVLKSERAIAVNIQIMRTFTKLRQAILNNEDLKKELSELKQLTEDRFSVVFETLDQLLAVEYKPKKGIGFTVKEKQRAYGKKMGKKKTP